MFFFFFSPSLVHYKLYLVSKVAAKARANSDLKPENFRGEGGPRTSKKKRLLNFTENEFEVRMSDTLRLLRLLYCCVGSN